jgi:methylmalonyl-CoA mutase
MKGFTNKIRFVTAASLFDGHDAAIHVMRRILQAMGAEVIHLGHNRSVDEVVTAAIQEDAQGIAVSSYQGGHVEYFTYMLDLLKERGASHIRVYGGGGGVIVPEEIELLHKRGVARIFSPDDGLRMGLEGMIEFMLRECDHLPGKPVSTLPDSPSPNNALQIARAITTLEMGDDEHANPDYVTAAKKLKEALSKIKKEALVIGFTGTGGAGKSSLIDEFMLRYLEAFTDKRIAVLTVDPTRKRTGGALLGDRIRMNSASNERVFVRSLATRRANLATSVAVTDALQVLKHAGFDLLILETAGIGQSDTEVVELSNVSVYVMTPEFGAPSQLEKIDMLDYADVIVINKFDKRGAQDALRDVRKTYQRNRKLFDKAPDQMPVFPTSAHRFNDPGTNRFFNTIMHRVSELSPKGQNWKYQPLPEGDPSDAHLIPLPRTRYLGEIADTIRAHHKQVERDAEFASRAQACDKASAEIEDTAAVEALKSKSASLFKQLSAEAKDAVEHFSERAKLFEGESYTYEVRGKDLHLKNFTNSLSNQAIPKVSPPTTHNWDGQIRFSGKENFPGSFPYSAGVFPFRRESEDPTRMFAGEGLAEQTNRRFHYLCLGQKSHRLSTAFDSVTLYGADPALRPDIFGKIGNSGVSIATLDDAKRLYSGFDLCSPQTSVSMTINGPAPTILAFFMNAAIDTACERALKKDGKWNDTQVKIDAFLKEHGGETPQYRSKLPEGHDGTGLAFLGVPASFVVEPEFYGNIKTDVLKKVRGTVQADILKEDQAQNTCIFSIEYALKMMGDVQQYFIQNHVRNFYSVSISGYHIAEAGANPITQLALTLANGFTLVEYYRARGMPVDAFAPNLSFFFSNGIDPEYAVIGRVARRIWAIAMRDLYEGNERSQKLKYHIQTSGRSLHAQEIQFNDIRTTLQALYAIMDNCNSLHTNAFDEAITTPTEDSVRRAVAIQLIINRELGLMKNENPLQGSYFIEYLTDLVEEAVLKEFESINARGGVLGAMETMYQRSKIQEESLHYEHLKHSGELPIVGINTFRKDNAIPETVKTDLIRSSDDDKRSQVDQVAQLKNRFAKYQPDAIRALKKAAIANQNIFETLMDTSKVCSLGMISQALYEVGGAYRRNM